jgi:hypothetical protein
MRKLIPLILTGAALSLGVLSCKKSGNNPPISGKWNIVNDSTNFDSPTYGGINPSYHSNYIGQQGDYFDFSTGGMMYTKEGTVVDSMAYEIVQGQVHCSPSPGFYSTYAASNVTTATATFTIKGTISGGNLTKIINLSR